MTPRPFDFHNDYATLQIWWAGHGQESVPLELLPLTGFIVDDLAACFVYSTDSAICILEAAIANPESHWEERKQALNALIDQAKAWAKSNGYKVILSSSNNAHVIQKLETRNFLKSDLMHQLACMVY